MYDKVTKGDTVIFKEGGHIDMCIVKSVKKENDMKYFELVSKTSAKTFTVSVNESSGGAYCPWRFVSSSELADVD